MSKPHLAEDWVKEKLVLPACILPKIDGVRALHLVGGLTGRSLKPHKNWLVTKLFSHPGYTGLDGELAAGKVTSDSLCRNTTAVLNRFESKIIPDWHLFDLIDEDTSKLGYAERYEHLTKRVNLIKLSGIPGSSVIHTVPMFVVKTMTEVEKMHALFMGEGYEGSVIRDMNGLHKDGRSTVKEGGYLRIKDFVHEDAVILDIVEGHTNGNEAKTNELGRTERSSHKANMVPNGMVGMLICRDVKTGKIIEVAAGCMTHGEREYYFKNPSFIIGKTIKYKCFPKGVLNKPRFPTFQCFRVASDMVYC